MTRPTILALIAIFVLALISGPALAQSFTLTEDDEWTEETPPEPGTPEAEIAEIRRALASNRPHEAQVLATRFIDRYPRQNVLAEAHVLRAHALFDQREYYEALFDLEVVARRYPFSPSFVPALEREFEIAKLFASGMKRKLYGMRIVGAEDEAEELFIRVQERLPGSRLAEEAGITLGDFYFDRRQMKLASEAYLIFIENNPRSTHLPKARRRQIIANLAAFKGPQFDPAGLYEARERLRRLKLADPLTAEALGADALLVRIDESDAEKLLETALWYRRSGDSLSCEFTMRRLVRTYPTSVAAARALRIIPDVLEELPASIREQVRQEYQARADALPEDVEPTDAAMENPASTATPPTTQSSSDQL